MWNKYVIIAFVLLDSKKISKQTITEKRTSEGKGESNIIIKKLTQKLRRI